MIYFIVTQTAILEPYILIKFTPWYFMFIFLLHVQFKPCGSCVYQKDLFKDHVLNFVFVVNMSKEIIFYWYTHASVFLLINSLVCIVGILKRISLKTLNTIIPGKGFILKLVFKSSFYRSHLYMKDFTSLRNKSMPRKIKSLKPKVNSTRFLMY